MKKRIAYTEVVDDMDGSPEANTITFSIQGERYEIDLSNENLKELHELLAPYKDAGRKLGGPRKKATNGRRARKGTAGKGSPDSASVRSWATEQGLDVKPTGRVPKSVVEQYVAAHHGSMDD